MDDQSDKKVALEVGSALIMGGVFILFWVLLLGLGANCVKLLLTGE